jgi:hypothetical protein
VIRRKYQDLVDIVMEEQKAALASLVPKRRGKVHDDEFHSSIEGAKVGITSYVSRKELKLKKQEFARDISTLWKQCDSEVAALRSSPDFFDDLAVVEEKKVENVPEKIGGQKSKLTGLPILDPKKISLSDTGNVIVDLRQDRARRRLYREAKKNQKLFRQVGEMAVDTQRHAVREYSLQVPTDFSLPSKPIEYLSQKEMVHRVLSGSMTDEQVAYWVEVNSPPSVEESFEIDFPAPVEISPMEVDLSPIEEVEVRPVDEREVLNERAYYKAVQTGAGKFHWINASGKKILKNVQGCDVFLARQNARAEAKWARGKPRVGIELVGVEENPGPVGYDPKTQSIYMFEEKDYVPLESIPSSSNSNLPVENVAGHSYFEFETKGDVPNGPTMWDIIKDDVIESETSSFDFMSFFDECFLHPLSKVESLIGSQYTVMLKDTLKMILQVCQLLITKSKEGVALIVSNFLLSMGSYTEKLKSLIGVLIRLIARQFVSESLADKIRNVRDFFMQVVSTPIATAIQTIVLTVIASKLTNFVDPATFKRYFGKIPSMCLLDVVVTILGTLPTVIGVIESVATGKNSISEVLFAEDPLTAFKKEVKYCVFYSDKVYGGMPVKGKVHLESLLMRCERALESGYIIEKSLGRMDSRKSSLQESLSELERVALVLREKVNSPKRTPPFTIVIFGPPGIGKANFVVWLCHIYACLTEMEFNEQMIYSKARNSPFWEGHDPAEQFCVHLSEMGNEHLQHTRTTKNDNLLELNSLHDSLPMLLNMAELSSKGKVYARPKLLIVDTNNRDMWISEQFGKMSRAAMYRRFLFLDCEILPEFKQVGTTAIDSEKSFAAGGNLLDRYNFTLTSYVANYDEVVPHIHFKNARISSATSYIAGLMAKHIKHHEELKEKLTFDFVNDIVKPVELTDDDERLVKDYDYLLLEDDTPLNEEKLELVSEGLSEWLIPDASIQNSLNGVPHVVYPDGYSRVATRFDRISIPLRNSLSALVCVLEMIFLICYDTFFFEFRSVQIQSLFVLYSYWCYNSFVFFPVLLLFLTRDTTKNYVDLLITSYGLRRDVASLRRFVLAKQAYINPLLTRKSAYVVAGLATFVAAVRLISSQVKAMHSEANIVSKVSDPFLAEIEEKNGSGAVRKLRLKNKDTPEWNRVDFTVHKPVFHGTVEEFRSLVLRNTYNTMLTRPEGWRMTTHILGIEGSLALINVHALGKWDWVDCEIYNDPGDFTSGFTKIRIERSKCVLVSDDVFLFDTLKKSFGNIKIHFTDSLFRESSGFFGNQDVRVKFVNSSCLLKCEEVPAGFIHLSTYLEYKGRHAPGFCGAGVGIQLLDKKFVIVGIHAAGQDNGDICAAAPVWRSSLEKALKQIKEISLFRPLLSESGLKFPRVLPGPKSMFNYERIDHVSYFANTGVAPFAKGKSKLVKAENGLSEILCRRYEFVPSIEFGKPMMQSQKVDGVYISPHNIYLRKMDKDCPVLDMDILERVVDEYTTRIISGLRADGVEHMAPITIMEAINGVQDDAFISRINPTTSAGFGFKGKKSEFLELQEDNYTRIPTREVMEAMVEIFRSYQNGEMAHPINKVQLKDEVREISKCLSGATRPFYMTPLDFLVVCREYLSDFYSHMVSHSKPFCTAVGIDMHRGGNDMLVDMLAWSDKFLEGDYSGFDVSNSIYIARAASVVVYRVCKEFGYNDEALAVVEGILSDTCFPFLEDLGDVFMKPGMQPSGRYATAEDNSLRGVLMLMYAWYKNPDTADLLFFDYCKPLVYGDDYLVAVKDGCNFDNLVYQKLAMECYGMKCTPAVKDSQFVPYLAWDEISFLKRNFVWSEQYNCYFAALDKHSLWKALDWIMPSNTVTEDYQVESTLSSVLWESFFHIDELTFTRMLGEMQTRFYEKYGRIASGLPSYSSIASALGL